MVCTHCGKHHRFDKISPISFRKRRFDTSGPTCIIKQYAKVGRYKQQTGTQFFDLVEYEHHQQLGSLETFLVENGQTSGEGFPSDLDRNQVTPFLNALTM